MKPMRIKVKLFFMFGSVGLKRKTMPIDISANSMMFDWRKD
jgi:hypothetical protein